ncbi:hypothetical protein Tco_0937986 [Tanacetum coccineum]|uniref:Xylulose kinase-1 n=1 Tax=Tanacetum coccineum TaxID=301880 RepID=A0ABQ5DFU3_9ASTR
MADLKFADTHNLVAFLEKPTKSAGFEEIVDFLNATPINYALTVNPTIYTSCIKQFWSTVKAKTVNGEVQLQALVDRKNIVITESTIRRDLQLEDAKGTDCLPNATIFEQLTLMGLCQILLSPITTPILNSTSTSQPQKKHKPRKPKKKDTQPSGPTTHVADEANNEENVSKHSNDPLLSGEDSLKLEELMALCTNLQWRVIDLENTKTAQAQEISSLKLRVNKLEKQGGSRTHKLKRLYKVGRSARIVSSKEASLGDHEDASKQGRKIDDIDADEGVTLVDETVENRERINNEEMFDTGVLNDEEVFIGQDMAKKEVSTTDPVTTVGEVVTTASVEATVQDKAEEEEEERLAREKFEANVALIEEWNDIQAKIKADQLLAKRLQERQQEELTIEERANLFQQLLEKRRKFFAAKSAEEKRNRPPTKAPKRSITSTYLKNMAGYKYNQLKNKTFDDIQKLFDKAIKRVNIFVDVDTEVEGSKVRVEGSAVRVEDSSSKRARDELEQESTKKQKMDEDKETAKLQSLMEVIPDKEEVTVDVIPLATKPLTIVDYKIIKEGKIGNYQIIRADGSSKRYSAFIQMLKRFDREDLETLWKLVKAKHGYTRLEEGYERVL